MGTRSLSSSIGFNSVLLGIFATITTAVLAVTFAYTHELIAEQQLKAQLEALSEILPPENYDNDLIGDGAVAIPPQHLSLLNLSGPAQAYIARKNGKPVAIIFPTVGAGYSSDVHLLVGIKSNGDVSGVRVTQHAETPGLGDYIDARKSDWILMFNGKSLTNPKTERWDTKKYDGEFDGLTSATISSRAVIHQVKAALEYFDQETPLQSLPQQTPPPMHSEQTP